MRADITIPFTYTSDRFASDCLELAALNSGPSLHRASPSRLEIFSTGTI